MYELKVKSSFSAAHALRGYGVPCENLHGHNYKVEVIIKASALNSLGIAIDFKLIKSYLEDIFHEVDHKYLNELSMFREENPSAEALARWIYNRLKAKVEKENKSLSLEKVTVYETDNFSAAYSED